jgi:drug/metabolite transporter (DMT)-like permease
MRATTPTSAAATLPASAKLRADNVPLGIACMIGATLMFAASNAIAKLLAATYPVGEVMFFRSATSLVFCAAIVLPTTGLSVFVTRRPRDHVARGLSQSISQTFTVLALHLMPLAAATAIGFSAPLFAALVAILFLKEKADPWRSAALACGFLGVLVITRPGAGMFQLGALFALANAVMYGSVTVAVRGMTKTESTLTLLMWQMATVAAFHSLLLVFGFAWPTRTDAVLFLSFGAANGVAQYLWTRALGFAPATAVSPFYYLLLVWAVPIGFVVWGDAPTPSLLAGSLIVVASGMALLVREGRAKREAMRRPAPDAFQAASDPDLPPVAAANAPIGLGMLNR